MLFNSISFCIFLPVVFILYWFVFNRSLKWQNLLLLVASYFFYGWWSWKFLFLLGLSTGLDFLYGFGVASPDKRRSKLFLWLSIINNLGILIFFKYYNFFAAEFQKAFELIGIHSNPLLLNIILPVGISFYTFHGMSYVFDIYRGVRKPITNIVDYAVFVSFFPLLIAGPIERANHLLPQIQSKRSFNYVQAVEGCRLILWGLFKKVVIADSLARIVDLIFKNYQSYDAFSLILAAVGFGFQIYADFSGYSDIALGSAKLMGFEIFSNFKFPYFSRNIAEFWRRWNISLTSWFRDYIYIPLGGSRDGKARTIRNVFIIFLLSGFWHGASWSFIIWGFIHACGFVPLLLLNRNRRYVSEIVAQHRMLPDLRELWQIGTTFAFVTLAWIFFRANTITMAAGYIKQIVVSSIQHPTQFFHLPIGKTIFLYIVPLLAADWWFRRDERHLRFSKKSIVNYFIYFILIASVILAYRNKGYNFIYFQF